RPAASEMSTLSLHDALPICNDAHEMTPATRWATRLLLRHDLEEQARTDGDFAGERLVVGSDQDNAGRHSYRKKRHGNRGGASVRSEEHTSELQSRGHLVCRL